MIKLKSILLFIVPFLIFFNNTFGRKVKVKNMEELKTAINKSIKGDSIIVSNNIYKDMDLLNIKNDEIVIMAEKYGSVIFTGNSSFKIIGSNNVISGFQFIDGDVGSDKGQIIEISGNNNLITQCNFSNFQSHNYIHIEEGAHHNEISFCNIEDKPAIHNAGPAIQISTSETIVNHTWIHHCIFQNFKGEGGDFGNEPIRIGLGKEQNNISATIIENCYFENLGLADNETISVKSTSNVIRYNTFNNNPLGQVTFRTGNKNSAYGNYFINSGGIRIKEGQQHAIYNNYFQGKGNEKFATLKLMNFKMNQKTNVGLPLKNICVYHNTFYEPGAIELGGEGANPPDEVYFLNNIFYKNKDTLFTDENKKIVFNNNLIFGTAYIGNVNQSVFIEFDPLMIENKQHTFSISKNSPAIDKAIEIKPFILNNTEAENDWNISLDIEGQKRDAKKDIGCDEYSILSPIHSRLNKNDVGPFYISIK